MSLRALIAEAYGHDPMQITGPAVLDSPEFDISAKMPDGSKPADARAMLQTLLRDRFGLALHRQTTSREAMALVVAKGGPKLKQAEPGREAALRGRDRIVGGEVASYRVEGAFTMAELAASLERAFGLGGGAYVAVLDMTGLDGRYEVAFDIPFKDLLNRAAAARTPDTVGVATREATTASAAPDSSASPAMFDSLKEFGLRLERRMVPLERIVVEHVERLPTEN